MFNSAIDGILVADPIPKIYLGNDLPDVGYIPGEIMTLNVTDIHPKESLQQFEKQLMGGITGRQRHS